MDTQLTKRYYKIREVAEIIGEAQSTLRFWEKSFPELNPRRSAHNQRFYTAGDIEQLQIIKYLLHTKGLKVESAREYLKHNKKNISRNLEVIAKLEKTRAELEILLHALNLRGKKLGIDKLDSES